MRLLFTLDRKDYDPQGSTYVRPSVRGILIREGRVAMVHSRKYDYYKFPGGGIRPGEDHQQVLCREVREEAGLQVRPESIRPYGRVYRIEKGFCEDVFIQDNFYYLCEAAESLVAQDLDEYEQEAEFALEFVFPSRAIRVNRCHDHGDTDQTMLEREAMVLERLVEEGYFSAKP